MDFSQILSVILILASIVGVYVKLQIDIAVIKNNRVNDLKAFEDHKNDNKEDLNKIDSKLDTIIQHFINSKK